VSQCKQDQDLCDAKQPAFCKLPYNLDGDEEKCDYGNYSTNWKQQSLWSEKMRISQCLKNDALAGTCSDQRVMTNPQDILKWYEEALMKMEKVAGVRPPVPSNVFGDSGGSPTSSSTAPPQTTVTTKVVTNTMTLSGVDFDKVSSNSMVMTKLIEEIKAGYLASLPGYSATDLAVVLTRGSVKATVTVTPKAGDSSSSLALGMNLKKTAMESEVLDRVKAMPEATELLETGKTLSDLTVASSTASESTSSSIFGQPVVSTAGPQHMAAALSWALLASQL
jgi:hypothetical protein